MRDARRRAANHDTRSAGQTAARLAEISRRLSNRLARQRFSPPVAHVYDPLRYAREPHERYLSLARPSVDAVFLGMNPGPFGMAQTGVPFGEIAAVREFLGIEGRVRVPADTHPKRPVQGFDCPRSEVSGRRFWGLMRELFGTRERCLSRMFVWNLCPLAFLSASGSNITPDKLPREERERLLVPCDDALREVVEALSPRLVIGVGAFARAAAERALGSLSDPPAFGQILHPSPASPAANRGWDAPVRRELARLGFIAK